MAATQHSQDVGELLLARHEQVKDLFTQVRNISGEPKQHTFHNLVRLLAVLECAEEQVVRPAARHDAGDDVVDARLHEEDEAEHVLSQLYELGVKPTTAVTPTRWARSSRSGGLRASRRRRSTRA